jgi:hypothetical protein
MPTMIVLNLARAYGRVRGTRDAESYRQPAAWWCVHLSQPSVIYMLYLEDFDIDPKWPRQSIFTASTCTASPLVGANLATSAAASAGRSCSRPVSASARGRRANRPAPASHCVRRRSASPPGRCPAAAGAWSGPPPSAGRRRPPARRRGAPLRDSPGCGPRRRCRGRPAVARGDTVTRTENDSNGSKISV